MEIKEKAIQAPDQFRMERSIITQENINSLYQVNNDHVAEAIIYYICYQHQYDLFGFGRLDPEIFSKEYGFSRQYLSEKVSEPFQLKINPIEYEKRKKENSNQLFCNRIENALFTLGNMTLYIMSTLVDDEKKLIRRTQFLHILKEIYIETDKLTGKKTYVYKLEDSFRRNLSSYYLNTSRNTLVKLRKSGLAPLYHAILRLKEALFSEGKTSTEESNTPNFAYLCEVAGISKNLEPKYQKRDLKEAFEKIKKYSTLSFDVEWIKGENSKEKYTPIFHFNPMLGETLDQEGIYARMQKKETGIDIITIDFLHNLLDRCPEQTYENYIKGEGEKKFMQWITKTNPGTVTLLQQQLINAYVDSGIGQIPQNIAERISKIQKTAKECSFDEFKEKIKEIIKLK